MATNPNQAGFASALARGAQGLAQGMEDRTSAMLAKKQGEQQIREIEYTDDKGAWQQKIDEANAASKKVTQELQREKTFRSLKAYTADGNVRHLNGTVLDEARQSGIVRFNKLNPIDDAQLFRTEGIDVEDYLGEYADSIDFVKATMQDGSEKILSTYSFKKAVGFFKNLTEEEIATELSRNEAKTKAAGKTYGPGAMEKDARFIDSQGVGGDLKSVTKKLYDDKTMGNKAGQQEESEVRTEQLNSLFGGDFMTNFDPTDDAQRMAAYPHISAIERFEGTEFGSAERKEFRDISTLLALGEPGTEMTEQETGIIDSLVTDVKRYVTNEGGSEAVSAYAAFRNSLRHALYGSALTESEIKSFNEQFGTRRQQLGPLIKQMKTAMVQVQSKLKAIADMQNPYSARFRLGASQDRADDIVYAMDQRIQLLEDLESGKSTQLTPETQETVNQRAISGAFN